MNHANEINDLIEEMTDNVTEANKDILVPKILKEGLLVWQGYNSSRLRLNLTQTDFELHLKMLRRLWNLAERFNVSEKVAFPIL